MHFVATPEDRCLLSRGDGASRVMVGSHVDGIISKGKSAALDRFYAEFQSKFRITIQRGPHISYTGLSITRQSPRADLLFVCVHLATFPLAPTQSHYLHVAS